MLLLETKIITILALGNNERRAMRAALVKQTGEPCEPPWLNGAASFASRLGSLWIINDY